MQVPAGPQLVEVRGQPIQRQGARHVEIGLAIGVPGHLPDRTVIVVHPQHGRVVTVMVQQPAHDGALFGGASADHADNVGPFSHVEKLIGHRPVVGQARHLVLPSELAPAGHGVMEGPCGNGFMTAVRAPIP